MALLAKKGTFVLAPGDASPKQIRGVGFQGKALLVWGGLSGAVDEAWVANASLSLGMADEDGAQGYITIFDADGAASQDAARAGDTNSLLRAITTSASFGYELDFAAWDADGFDLTITAAAGANRVIHYLVLGGSDITDSKLFTFTPALAATQDVTVAAGFGQPDLCFLMSQGTGPQSSIANTSGHFALGVFNKALERAAAYVGLNDAVATMRSASFLAAQAVGIPSIDGQDALADIAALANWPTDGFELTWSDQAAAATRQVIGLALRGNFQSKIGLANSPTSAGNQDLNAGFAPVASVFFTDDLPAHASVDAAHADGHGMSLGAYDGTTQGLMDFQTDDAAADAISKTLASDADVIRLTGPGSPPVNRGVAVASYTGNNVQLAWTAPVATARQFAWMALGSGGGTPHSTSPADGAGVTDSVALTLTRAVALDEPVGLGDSQAPQAALERALADGLGVADSPATAAVLVREAADGLGVADAAAPAPGWAEDLADGLGAQDSIDAAIVLLLPLADGLGAADSAALDLGRALELADGAGLADALARAGAFERALADGAGLADQAAPAAAFARALADALGLADQAAAEVLLLLALSAGAGATDSTAREIARAVVLGEALALADAAAARSDVSRALADGLSVADALELLAPQPGRSPYYIGFDSAASIAGGLGATIAPVPPAYIEER